MKVVVQETKLSDVIHYAITQQKSQHDTIQSRQRSCDAPQQNTTRTAQQALILFIRLRQHSKS